MFEKVIFNEIMCDGYQGYRKWVDTTVTSARDLVHAEGSQDYIGADDGQGQTVVSLSVQTGPMPAPTSEAI